MRAVLSNEKLNQVFFEKGYIQIEQFLAEDEVNHLRKVYENNYQDNFDGFHACMHSLDVEYRRTVHQEISKVFIQHSKSLLKDYKPIVGNFTVKESGENSFFDFHLDWNMLDESSARSITIWVALEDTNANNGNLWILEGSTHMGPTWRCSPGLHLFAENTNSFLNFKGKRKVLPMKKGDALIYDHKLFHGSPANLSDSPRLAINLAMIPAELTSIHYHLADNVINGHAVDDDFYCRCLTHHPMDMSEYPIVSSTPISSDPILQDQVNALITNYV